MKIVCIGDSFTSGEELPNPELHAWPVVLGTMLSADSTNMGLGGCTNARIIKRALDVTFSKSADIIIVAWSNPCRSEIADKDGLFNYWPSRNINFIGKPSRANLVKVLAVEDNENLHTWAHRRWLRDIILLQTFFKANNQKYIMLQSHESQFYNRQWLVESQVHDDIGQYVSAEHFLGWPLDGIVEWVGDAPKAKHGHPLELGHKRIAEKLNEYIRNLGWLS